MGADGLSMLTTRNPQPIHFYDVRSGSSQRRRLTRHTRHKRDTSKSYVADDYKLLAHLTKGVWGVFRGGHL